MRPSRTLGALFVILLTASMTLAGCIIPAFDADCTEGTDCESCLELSGCGWCGSSCLPGTAFGPEDGGCTPSYWRFAACDEVSNACNDTCSWANDGACDEPPDSSLCDPGTDCTDCRGR